MAHKLIKYNGQFITYDANGNITRITQAGNVAYEYEYDVLGQLTRVDDYVNDETVTYQYDANGNLTWEIHHDLNDLETDNWRQYRQYDNTTWRDLLTYYFDSETDERVNITYDAIGNPANWRNGMTFTWEGRSLKKVMKDSATLATYTYNADGVRVKKVSGGVTTTYYVEDGVCYGESRSDGKSLQYLRDENGQVVGVRYQNGTSWDTTYYFVFNGQGDVIQVVSAEDGQVMANYTYDAWGKLLSVTNAAGGAVSADAESIAAVNPFRYRGYYYDTETGFYYLQSRHYDPDVGRFVNADGSIAGVGGEVLGYNLFAYCFNNPVNMDDWSGDWPNWLEEIGNRFVHTVTIMAKIVASPFKAITAEIGIGFGLGIKHKVSVNSVPVELGAVAASTDSLVYEEGEFDARNTTTAAVSVNVAKVFDFSQEKGVRHSYFHEKCTCDFMKSTVGEKSSCSANQPFVSSDAMLSFSMESYCVVGAKISASVDLKSWGDELISIFNESMSYGE